MVAAPTVVAQLNAWTNLYSGSPINTSATNLAAGSFTVGSVVNYVTNGMTTVVAGNGGTLATATLGATPAFTVRTATTTNVQTSRTFVTVMHTASDSYVGSTAVTWSGTTSKWSGVVAVSLQP